MHYAAKIPIDLPRLDALAASLRDWLLALAAWLIETFGDGVLPAALKRELRDEVMRAAYDIKRALLIYAAKDLRQRRPEPKRAKPYAGPPGFRLAPSRASVLRMVTRGVFKKLNTGPLTQRIARLRDLLARRDVWVARLMRRLARGFIGARLTRIAPPNLTLTPRADAPSAASADTS